MCSFPYQHMLKFSYTYVMWEGWGPSHYVVWFKLIWSSENKGCWLAGTFSSICYVSFWLSVAVKRLVHGLFISYICLSYAQAHISCLFTYIILLFLVLILHRYYCLICWSLCCIDIIVSYSLCCSVVYGRKYWLTSHVAIQFHYVAFVEFWLRSSFSCIIFWQQQPIWVAILQFIIRFS